MYSNKLFSRALLLACLTFSLALTACGGSGGSSPTPAPTPAPAPTPSPTGDTTGPVTTITNPGNNQTLEGSVDVMVNTTDVSGISKVDYFVDGNLFESISTSPFNVTWNTLLVSDGEHIVMVKSYDDSAAKNVTTVDISVMVSNDPDQDGVRNGSDLCADTPSGEPVNDDGCSDSQLDDDGDGVMNNTDLCSDTSFGESVNDDGCSDSQLDDDSDSVMNNTDLCSDTPFGESVNTYGCSDSQLDDDSDGVMNNVDDCPNTPANTSVYANGCDVVPETAYTLHWFKVLDPVAFESDFATKTFEAKACVSGTDVAEVELFFLSSPVAGTSMLLQEDPAESICASSGSVYSGSFVHGFDAIFDEDNGSYGGKVVFYSTSVRTLDDQGDPLISSPAVNTSKTIVVIADSEAVAIETLAGNIIVSDDVVNVVQPILTNIGDLKATYQDFLGMVQDVYTLSVVARYGNQIPGGAGQLGIPGAIVIRNDIQGIGKPIFNSSSEYGSNLLQHIGFMNTSIANKGVIHELLGHLYSGSLDDESLNLMVGKNGVDPFHLGHSDLVNGQMRTGFWLEIQGDGNFLAKSFVAGGVFQHLPASALDQYLAGLDTLPSFYAITDSTMNVVENQVISSNDVTAVTQGSMESVYGLRIPSVTDSPKDFNIAFIVSSEEPLSAAAFAWESLKSRHYCSTSSLGSFENGVLDPIGFPAYTHFKATFDCKVKLR